MKRAAVFVLCLGLTAACGGNKDETEIAEREPSVADRGDGRPVAVTETGCVTADGDRFVLTALKGDASGNVAAGEAKTESYQLVGKDDELRPLVGRQVTITGEADPPKVAEVRESSPPASASGATGTTGQATPAKPGEPQVSTSSATRLEVTQLRVQSITATGEACPAR
jgi:hypothetical protein